MIHICYSIYDGNGRYSKFTGTSMLSMFENTRAEVTVHLLHDGTLTSDNREKFLATAKKFGHLINFYDVEKICAAELADFQRRYPKLPKNYQAIMYRLWLPKILNVEVTKIIYLDSDTIINLDISELWRVELGDNVLAAIPESANGTDCDFFFPICHDGFVKAENYFNSGVLVIDVEKFGAAQKKLADALDLTVQRNYLYVDQDILNYCFSEKTLKLPIKFNRLTLPARRQKDFVTDNRIFHFAGGSLTLNCTDAFNKLWLEYFIKSAWFTNTLDLIDAINDAMEKFFVNEKNSMIKLSALVAGKGRAFFVDADLCEGIIAGLMVKDDEDIIVANSKQSIKTLLSEMVNCAGKKVFFIAVAFYDKLSKILTKAGFVEGVDFIDGMELLPNPNNVSRELLNGI